MRSPDLQRAESLFDGLVAPASRARLIALSTPVDDAFVALLHPDERRTVERSMAKRQREFATARHLARVALGELGVPHAALRSREDRAPVWPDGAHGSLSHCDRRAVVAVIDAQHGTVGVDVEHREELKRDLWKTVFLPDEIASLDASFDAPLRGRMALALFSAKEALYKAQYPRTATYMGFAELRVELVPTSGAEGELRCVFQNDVVVSEPAASRGDACGPGFARGELALGRYALDPFGTGELVTVVHLPRR